MTNRTSFIYEAINSDKNRKLLFEEQEQAVAAGVDGLASQLRNVFSDQHMFENGMLTKEGFDNALKKVIKNYNVMPATESAIREGFVADAWNLTKYAFSSVFHSISSMWISVFTKFLEYGDRWYSPKVRWHKIVQAAKPESQNPFGETIVIKGKPVNYESYKKSYLAVSTILFLSALPYGFFVIKPLIGAILGWALAELGLHQTMSAMPAADPVYDPSAVGHAETEAGVVFDAETTALMRGSKLGLGSQGIPDTINDPANPTWLKARWFPTE